MSTFTVQLRDFADKARGRADDVVGLVTVKIAQRLDQRSPVGDPLYWQSATLELHSDGNHKAGPKGYVGGRFRGNWQLGVNVVPAGETGRIDPAGEATLGTIVASVPEHPAGTMMYLANNVPYAQRIEDGWSRQAPTGLVALTASEFPSIVRQAAQS